MWPWINSNVSWSGYNPPCLGYRSLKVIKVVWLKEGKALPGFALVSEHKFWHGDLQWAHFYPVRNDFSQQSKNRLKIKRAIGCHILNRLNFNIIYSKEKPQKQPILPSFKEGTEKKCQWQLERRLHSMDVHIMHAHTLAIHTERDLQITSCFGKEKFHQKVETSTKSEEKY